MNFISKHFDQTQITLIKALSLTIALIIMCLPFGIRLINAWNTKAHASHGYFIVPLCIGLIWQQREKWRDIKIKKSPILGGTLTLLGITIYFIGLFTSIDTIISLSVMLSLAGVILVTLGTGVFKAYWFPYLFLVFMFPIPDALYVSLTVPLKLIASEISATIIGLTGVSVFLDGNIIELEGFKMEVVEACSGLRFFMAYVMLGVILAHSLKNKPIRIAILLTTIIPTTLLGNIVRISGTGLLASLVSTKIAQGFYHEVTGYISFVIGLILLFGIFSILNKTKTI